jgi:hypothetical protein
MAVKPVVSKATIALRDDSEQLHADVRKLMQELFPEQWGVQDADHMQARCSPRLRPANITSS